MKKAKSTKGITAYICIGNYAGFKIVLNTREFRIILGWLSICIVLFDLEIMASKLHDQLGKTTNQLNAANSLLYMYLNGAVQREGESDQQVEKAKEHIKQFMQLCRDQALEKGIGKLYDVARDGYIPELFDKAMVGRTAFIFDGCVVSGWLLDKEEGYWEADSDVGRHGKFTNVKKYIIFPKPLWEIEKDK